MPPTRTIDRRMSPANVAARARLHKLLDERLDIVLTSERCRYGRETLDIIIQDHTVQHEGAGFVPYEK